MFQKDIKILTFNSLYISKQVIMRDKPNTAIKNLISRSD